MSLVEACAPRRWRRRPSRRFGIVEEGTEHGFPASARGFRSARTHLDEPRLRGARRLSLRPVGDRAAEPGGAVAGAEALWRDQPDRRQRSPRSGSRRRSRSATTSTSSMPRARCRSTPRSVIGDRVGVMHNVTIGTNMGAGAPVIGDDVFIGVNSTVLGPIRVGDRVRIAANTAVTTERPGRLDRRRLAGEDLPAADARSPAPPRSAHEPARHRDAPC